MKFYLTLGTAAAAMIASPTMAAVIDFESAPSTFTSYTTQGVTFTADGQEIGVSSSPAGSSALLSLGSPRAEITATFSNLYNGAIAIDLGDFNGDADRLFLEVYSASNILISSISLLTLDSDMSMHTLSTSGIGISYAKFGAREPSLNGSSVFADNFTFSSVTPAVPEPATWAMMIAGFGAVGYSMRRRQRVAFKLA